MIDKCRYPMQGNQGRLTFKSNIHANNYALIIVVLVLLFMLISLKYA